MSDQVTRTKEQEKQDISTKIKLEKRKRYQAYTALDYFSSVLTYFDFFSVDTFKIITQAKYLGARKKQQINSEFLLLPYFLESSKILDFLPKSEMRNRFQALFFRDFKIQLVNNKKEIFNIFKQKENFKNSQLYFAQNTYTHEVYQLFEKAIENALTRFKTPVITSEILFLTMLEEKNCKAGSIIQNLFETEMEWYLFRYKVIKYIHNQESKIRSEVSKNQQYFAYLLKTQLPDAEFNCLIEKMELSKGVLQFRNELIMKFLQLNIFDALTEEITTSIRTTNQRQYSS